MMEADNAATPQPGLARDPVDQQHLDVDFAGVPEINRLLGSRLLKRQNVPGAEADAIVAAPASFSLRSLCGKVRDQGNLNACTAHAAVALLEVIEARFNRRTLVGSPMFVYKVSRDFLRWKGDAGAFLRTSAGSLGMFGVVPEDYWPYDPALLDQTPPPFCYQLAQQFRATRYFRIDSAGVPAGEVISRVKALLVNGLPSMLGYAVFLGSEFQARSAAGIVLPLATDIQIGRHALMVCGYDDQREVVNTSAGGEHCQGAFLVQNSRGAAWGDEGFGWLPYACFERGLVNDVWSVVNAVFSDLHPYQEKDEEGASRSHAGSGESGAP